jgi:alginate O-acetyltransferase complex protein AlgI
MYFGSIDYFIFIIVVFLCYWRMKRKSQNLFLLFASYFFYGYWDWRFLSLIFISTTIDFISGNQIYQSVSKFDRKKWLMISLVVNLGLLGYFKYVNFFADSFIDMANTIGWHVSSVTLNITLPVGISFYTFQSLSYTLDIYRGRLKPSKSFIDFAAFVAFFPQLVAGPIVRAKEFIFQLEDKRLFRGDDLQAGSIRFLIGYLKKAFIADTLAIQLVDPIFSNPGNYSSSSLAIGLLGFSVQVYCDFSGYSDMAIGSARILGFRLPENFKYPYLAKNFSEFWNRWHLTMGRFFRDYLYIPLGGNHGSSIRWIINLSITWLLIGLWHGASWIYVTWGALHGFFILLNHFIAKFKNEFTVSGKSYHSINLILSWTFTQLFLCLISGYFRLPDMNSGTIYLKGLLENGGQANIILTPFIIIAFILFTIEHLYGWLNEKEFKLRVKIPETAEAIVYIVMIVFLYHSVQDRIIPFIYFQF